MCSVGEDEAGCCNAFFVMKQCETLGEPLNNGRCVQHAGPYYEGLNTRCGVGALVDGNAQSHNMNNI